MRPLLEGGGDLPRQNALASGPEVANHVHQQLGSAADIKAAHGFLQPTGGEFHLPQIAGFAGGGADLSSLQLALKTGEAAAMTTAQQAANQAVSPLIQMIMRMPGHIGIMSGFFEALSHFFFGHDLLGGLLDPSFLAHNEGLMNAISHAWHNTMHGVSHGAEHAHVDLSLLPHGAPILHNLGHGAGSLFRGTDLMKGHSPTFTMQSSEGGQIGNALHVGGNLDLNHPIFERPPGAGGGIDGFSGESRYLAWDNNGVPALHPTMGNFSQGGFQQSNFSQGSSFQQPIANQTPGMQQLPQFQQQMPQFQQQSSAFQQPLTQQSLPAQSPPAQSPPTQPLPGRPLHTQQSIAQAQNSYGGYSNYNAPDTVPDKSGLPGDQPVTDPTKPGAVDATSTQSGQPADTQAASSGQPDVVSYSIKRGDNLWDISRHHLGDGTRWKEIYDLNRDTLGANPSLIHQGVSIQLPADANIANYLVKPGDNLWNISKLQTGDGQNWTHLYHSNQNVIGANPDLIHPGQQLTIDHGQVAGSAHPGHHFTSSAHSHGDFGGTHPHAHAGGHHGPHIAHHAQHNHVAHAHGAGHAVRPNHIAHASPSNHHATSQTGNSNNIAQGSEPRHAYSTTGGSNQVAANQSTQTSSTGTAGETVALRAKAGSLENPGGAAGGGS